MNPPATAVNPQTAVDLSAAFQELETGEMLPMPHGGALRKGNPGNSGRPSKEVKERWIELASGKAYTYAVECLTNPETSPQERIAAMKAAVSQLGTTITLDNDDFPRILADVLASHADQVPFELAQAIVQEVKEASGIK